MEDDGDGEVFGVAVVRVVQLRGVVVPNPIDAALPRLHQHRVDLIQETLQNKHGFLNVTCTVSTVHQTIHLLLLTTLYARFTKDRRKKNLTNIYYLELLCASDGTKSCWSRFAAIINFVYTG
jgi:hypothetical protein